MTTLASHAYGGSQSSVVTVLARPVRPSLRFLCLAIVAAIHVILRIPPGFFPQVAGQTGTDPQRRSPLIADPSNSMVQFALRLLSRSKAQVPVLHCMLLILNRLQDKVSVYTQGKLAIQSHHFSSADSEFRIPSYPSWAVSCSSNCSFELRHGHAAQLQNLEFLRGRLPLSVVDCLNDEAGHQPSRI